MLMRAEGRQWKWKGATDLRMGYRKETVFCRQPGEKCGSQRAQREQLEERMGTAGVSDWLCFLLENIRAPLCVREASSGEGKGEDAGVRRAKALRPPDLGTTQDLQPRHFLSKPLAWGIKS